MASLTLSRHSPRAAAYVAASQFGLGALQSALGLTLWSSKDPRLVPFLAGALVSCAVLGAAAALLASRLPWWAPFVGAVAGVVFLLVMCSSTWGDRFSSLLVAQLTLLVLTVSVFYGRRLVVGLVGAAVAGWAVVCAVNEQPAGAIATWLTVGPALVVTAVVAQWLVGQLLTLVDRDALTGLANRASWNRLLATVDDEPISVAIMDLDHFKAVNDGAGHAAGDELLRAVAARWAAHMRPCDTLARLGGDEFALLLTATKEIDALHVAERLRSSVAKVASVSVGVAERGQGERLDDAMIRADGALYRAKAEGRGCVRSATAAAVVVVVDKADLERVG